MSSSSSQRDTAGAARYNVDDGHLPENLLRHYAGVVRRRARWIVIFFCLGLALGIATTILIKPKEVTTHYYKATNTLVVTGSTAGESGNSSYSLQQAVLLVQSETLLDAVAKKLDMDPVKVSEQLTAIVRSDVNALDVTGIATSPTIAVQLADTAAGLLNEAAAKEAASQYTSQRATLEKKLSDFEKQRSDLIAKIATNPPNVDLLNSQLDSVVQQYGDVYNQLQTLTSTSPNFSLSTLQKATPIEINAAWYSFRKQQNINSRGQTGQSTPMTSPEDLAETDLRVETGMSKALRIGIGAIGGLVIGVIVALLVEAWDDRIRSRAQVEAITGLPVLAEIPKLDKGETRSKGLSVIDAAAGIAGERYRAARTSVLFALEDTGSSVASDDGSAPLAPVVMVTSPGPSEGKTTTAANIAAAMADSGLRTLVIDGDFRRPSIRAHLSPSVNLDNPDGPDDTQIPNVSFLAAPQGVRSPGEAQVALRAMIDRWRDQFDIIVLDTPPMLTTNDASDLLAAADAVLLVVRNGQTRTGAAQRVASVLGRFQAPILGIVLNACENVDMQPYYGYGYGYGYGGYGYGTYGPSSEADAQATNTADDQLSMRHEGAPSETP